MLVDNEKCELSPAFAATVLVYKNDGAGGVDLSTAMISSIRHTQHQISPVNGRN
jgi:hypothetical protein